MPLTVRSAPFGPPSLNLLCSVLAEVKEGDALAPATVVVPNNFVGITARRTLAGGQVGFVVPNQRGLAAVDFLTIYRLAELLGAPKLAASGRRPVSTPVIAAAVRATLSEIPGVFAHVAQHPTTERRLVSAHKELSELDQRQLATLSAQSQRAHDVVAIHRRVKKRLAPDWYGEQDLIDAAVQALHGGHDEQLAHTIGPTVLYLPDLLSPARATLICAVAEKAPVVLIAGVTGAEDADAQVQTNFERLGLQADPGTEAAVAIRPHIRLASVSDADDEVRYVVREIVAAAAEGVGFDRMAVFFPDSQPYARLLHDHLPAAGVPVNGAAISNLGQSVPGRLLTRLLNLPGRSFRREDVMAMLAGAPLRWDQRPIPTRAWDQVSRLAGVVKGANDWDTKLATFVADQEQTIADLQSDPDSEWRVRRCQNYVLHAASLRDFMADLSHQLALGGQQTQWGHIARWCKRLLNRYLGDQSHWPEPQRKAKDRLEATLDRLSTLDSVEPEATMDVFRRTLDLDLESGLGRSGSFGNGVLIGHIGLASGLHLDRVWVVGLSEGTFPARHRDDSLLPDRERLVTATLPLRSEATGDQHRHLLAALASAGADGQATLLRPRGDLRQSNERAPCRWLPEVLGAIDTGGSTEGLDTLQESWVTHVPSFAGGVLASAFAPTDQEYALKSLVRFAREHGDVDSHPMVQAGGPLAPGHELQSARASARFTRFDGNLAGAVIPSPTHLATPTSATALETWARCPQRYFMEQVLRVAPLDTPEQRQRIDPLSKGTLVHTILERFVATKIGAHSKPKPTTRGWSFADRQRMQEVASEAFAEVEAKGLTGEPLYWRRDQVLIRRDLDAFVELDHERRHTNRLTPLATELAFGLGGAPPVEILLPSGQSFLLRGSIDLVDIADDGHLVVVDYKTGKSQKMTASDPHKGGTKLQLVLYANAARSVLSTANNGTAQVTSRTPVSSYYWHIHAASKYKLEGYDVSPEVQQATLGAVETIIDNIAAGVFTQHPEESTRTQWVSCDTCDPDGLGTAEARRRFVRKAVSPTLTDYLVLAEPSLAPAATLEPS